MGKKKRKHGGVGLFASIGSFLTRCGKLCFQTTPLIFLISLVGLLFFGVRQALFADSHLLIDRVNVEPSQAVSIAKRQELESRLIGKNILAIDLQKISADLERDPLISRAQVVRELPGQLTIVLSRRNPVARIQFSPRGLYGTVSEDGMVLNVFEDARSALFLIEAYGTGARAPEIGIRIRRPGFREVVKFIQEYWERPLAKRKGIAKASFDHLGNVTVYFDGGPEIRLGRRPREKFSALERVITLLEEENPKKIDYIDLQFDNVIVKHKK